MSQLSDDCFAFGGPLMTAGEALDLMRRRIGPIGAVESVPLGAAGGRVLASDLFSPMAVPPHDNVAVDGYAFRHADLVPGADTRLGLAARIAAGHPAAAGLAPGSAARVFTGAVVPAGADTVAMQEDVRLEDGAVVVPPGLKPGANTRRAGEDVAAGALLLGRGTRLRAQELGLAASAGRTDLPVFRRLVAAVFSTGVELREPGRPLGPGQAYDANRPMLAELLRGLGCTVDDLGILPDDAAAVRDGLAAAAERSDLLVTSGGVSSGEEDHVRAAVAALGDIHLWRLAIKPGRPLALGRIGDAAFIGLPGNPVAAMVCFLRFARPLILRRAGACDLEPTLFRVTAGFDHRKKAGRREWVRCRLGRGADGRPTAERFPRQGSGILSSMVASDGLVELDEDLTELRPGMPVDFLPFSEVSA